MRRLLALLSVALTPAAVSATPAGYFDLQPGITLETGDTWVSDGQKYRLFGVQSCLRGTAYTDKSGQKRDCGDASLAVFAAYIKDTKPVCAPVAKTADLSYVVCYATVGKDRLDLATMMIASGYAFASLNAEGLPFHTPYAVAEQDARERRAGLWQFQDVQHPAVLLSRSANERAKKAKQ
ncbi:MAG: thermonuclease family protein [Mesorhizobium sp.]|uniref:thermonuclease family protein n=1 Tax=Mesorhizobium sp. TaxID=1871066 RepID=UPI000FE912BF|nr:thermonuclease family protein [Mesorhizobium sp.]RWG50482.1 MAG: thermonuclease family protein [Mesorhizobium sp.]RWL05239.1 MAG: thermonuclease family protein [Mesorhizobium sp.]TIN10262.1 MAG: thermonuclease family protein [Mesorhizobium sp.]TIQ62131.1 MAG: thermonuclease family protein [Mesorhizobium sp.]